MPNRADVSQELESRSPRQPAQYGRTVVRRLAARWLAALATLALVPFLLWFGLGLRGSPFAVVEALAIALMLLGDRAITPILDHRIQGNRGEQKVGAILDRMAGEGWLTLHDVDMGAGNIDHVVVGPGGLLTVETKSRRGRVSTADVDPKWLKQAYRQRKYLEGIAGMRVDCLLVFSDAYLDKAPLRQRGVLLLPARMLAGHLRRRRPSLAPERVAEIHRRLARALCG
jgi:Nuclease-related domain